ncbi:hypothetical protein LTS02_011292 [Friedmanniomyces endolithicus]|nr:hypothetical protein LTS02_011292 [Friedmanniomyces endolithicus]
MEEGIKATDESLLHADPYPTRDEWCARLVTEAETKLAKAAATGFPLVIINHWPLREDTIFIPRVPRFSLWCGTVLTKEWHQKYHAKVVVTGHLHVRRTDWIDGVRFEEVSLGYPRQWQEAKDEGHTVNTLLPQPTALTFEHCERGHLSQGGAMGRAFSGKTRRPASRVRSPGKMANTTTTQGVGGSYHKQRDPARLSVSICRKDTERASKQSQNVLSDWRAKLSHLRAADAA